MTQTAAIAKALLAGQVLSIMNGFQLFSCTNLPRELSRGIEQKFGVEISREHVKFVSKYGQGGHFYRYRLNRTPYNEKGIQLMIAYLKEQEGTKTPRTDKEEKQQSATKQITQLHQPQLFQ